VMIHRLGYVNRRAVIFHRFFEHLKNRFSRTASEDNPVKSGEDRFYSKQAKKLCEKVRKIIKQIEEKGYSVSAEVESLLDSYMSQVITLEDTLKELEEVLRESESSEMDADLKELTKKKDAASNDALIQEYDKRIDEFRRKKAIFTELENAKDIIAVRCDSALDTLKTIHLDFVRMKNMGIDARSRPYTSLKQKADELSEYLMDIQKSLTELETSDY